MKKTITLFFLFLSIFICNSSYSQDGYILIVGSSTDDETVVQILEDEDYTVVRGLNYSGILSQAKLDSVNGADLVIFSRNGSTYGHGDESSNAGIVEQWANVTAPILSLSPWIMRSNRWQWINSELLKCGTEEIYIPADAEEHAIFTSVEIPSSQLVNFTEVGVTVNEFFSLNTDTGDTITLGNGKLLAYDSTKSLVSIAEWEAGTPFYDGAPTPQSKRLWVGISEGDNCAQDANVMSAFNGTDDGKTIFLNSVAYMLGTLSSIKNNFVSELAVYPNPANNILQISGLDSFVRYRIISVTGEVVLSGLLYDNIDISSLVSGVYILNTENNQWIKFIKK